MSSMGAKVSSPSLRALRPGDGLGALSRLSQLTRQEAARKCQEQERSTRFFGVLRHTERADDLYTYYEGGRWSRTGDAARWLSDPPLGDSGVVEACRIAKDIHDFMEESSSQLHVVITSPYLRCIQTAVEVCAELCSTGGGADLRILVDRSLGEVYGPAVLGSVEPRDPVRGSDDMLEYMRRRGVACQTQIVGRWPKWPEDLRTARRRFASRFLTYLHRSTMTKHNFLLVTHGDCVRTALSMMPSQESNSIQKVQYGGMFLAKRSQEHELIAPALGSTFGGNALPSCSAGVPTSLGLQPALASAAAVDTGEGSGRGGENDLAVPEAGIDEPLFLSTCSDVRGVKKRSNSRWPFHDVPVGSPINPARLKRTLVVPASLPKMGGSFLSAATSSGGSDEANPMKPNYLVNLPKASCNWEVQTSRIILKTAPRDKAGALNKRIKKAAKHSELTRDRIEMLLGANPHRAMDTEEFGLNMACDFSAADSLRVAPFPMDCSMSTFLFGASNVSNLDDMHSHSGLNTPDSGVEGWQFFRQTSCESSGSGVSRCTRSPRPPTSECPGLAQAQLLARTRKVKIPPPTITDLAKEMGWDLARVADKQKILPATSTLLEVSAAKQLHGRPETTTVATTTGAAAPEPVASASAPVSAVVPPLPAVFAFRGPEASSLLLRRGGQGQPSPGSTFPCSFFSS